MQLMIHVVLNSAKSCRHEPTVYLSILRCFVSPKTSILRDLSPTLAQIDQMDLSQHGSAVKPTDQSDFPTDPRMADCTTEGQTICPEWYRKHSIFVSFFIFNGYFLFPCQKMTLFDSFCRITATWCENTTEMAFKLTIKTQTGGIIEGIKALKGPYNPIMARKSSDTLLDFKDETNELISEHRNT